MPPTVLPGGLSLDDTLGAAFVGVVLAAFISGMTALQVVKYFQTDSGDQWYNKLSVVVLWVLDMLNTIFVIISGYNLYVCHYGSLDPTIGWSLKAMVWTLDFQVAFVHCLYAIRIWKLSKGSVLGCIISVVAVVWAVSAASYSIIVFTDLPSFLDIHKPRYQYVFSIPLAATAVLDLVLAVTLCVYVKPNATYRNMTSVMTSLVRFTFANGFATSFFSALGVITFYTLPESLIWLSCAIVMAKLYATSYLALLGSRRRWRERLAAPNMDVFGGEGYADTHSVSLGARSSAEKLRSSWDRPSWESSRKDSMSHPSPLLPKPAHLHSSV